ncbi:hypothetical protein [Pedobacter nutrimenti]|jgi:hypothetical protein|uniref:hypothetical protein n=1 Tax=Pedobacter nutrimenti TaxID=1241337 RepID=UPI00105BBD11|nr:hypothetical protein [Pedobacter nutrimenti]
MENKYVETIQVEKNGNYYIVHNLGTRDVILAIYEVATGQQITPDTRIVDKNTININFENRSRHEHLNEGKYRVVIRS